MTHKFDAGNKSKLDSEWRRKSLPPELTLEKLGLDTEDILADIGCGIGYFTIPAAKILNPGNIIYALDTSAVMLEGLKERALESGVSNIITIQTEEYDLKLPDEVISFGLLVNVFHEIEEKQKFIQEIKRVLKPEGCLAIIEWKKESMEMGPPVSHRLSAEEIITILERENFKPYSKMEINGTYTALVFKA